MWQEYVCYGKQLAQTATETQSSIVKPKYMSSLLAKRKKSKKHNLAYRIVDKCVELPVRAYWFGLNTA